MYSLGFDGTENRIAETKPSETEGIFSDGDFEGEVRRIGLPTRKLLMLNRERGQ